MHKLRQLDSFRHSHVAAFMQERGGSSVASGALTGPPRITCNGQLECEQGVEYLCETAGEKTPAASASDVASHDRRCRDTADSIDWEAVRAAQTDEVSAALLLLYKLA